MTQPQQIELFPDWVRKTLAVSFALVGLAPMAASGAILAYERTQDQASRHATGVVVDIESGTTLGAEPHQTVSMPMYPVVEVVDEGRTFRFQNEEGHSPPLYSVGQTVPVVYDPADPEHGAIDAGYSWWLVTPLCCVGVPFLAIATALLWPRPKR